ncbi:hypothetical protein DAEQUDRAFT_723470 [Daedalea quercina L-15889]|uniref:Uncharacterized protein n=1 Tax=Daedalea quercina L-15889 TaxID=1314783 RepID=A0A165SEA0_9APHY|nr:hypothetical protein DAEQUDRAFT_723470 [Daedalea quercina L-15889]
MCGIFAYCSYLQEKVRTALDWVSTCSDGCYTYETLLCTFCVVNKAPVGEVYERADAAGATERLQHAFRSPSVISLWPRSGC